MTGKLLSGIMLLGLLWGLIACSGTQPATPESTTLTVTDALGREVTLPAPPQRIAIGGRANFMISNALYLFPDMPPRVSALTRATKQSVMTFAQILDPDAQSKSLFESDAPAEEIAASKPDLVLLKSYMRESVGATLEQLGLPVIYLDLETPEQYERDLKTLGQALGNPERATELWAYYRNILDRVAKGTEGLADTNKPRVLLLQYAATGEEIAFKVPPASWIQTTLVTLAGGQPVWFEAAQGGGWAVVNLEQIAAWNPDQIYIINYSGSAAETVATLKADPQWAQIPAVGAGQILPFATDLYSWDQPDTRWGLGLLWLAKQIQPERFADIDMEAEFYRFYEDLYGLERATIDAKILPVAHLD
ncbi:MAG: ABC transporter substrate-binding protein [Anaerolineae bacterium]|nr:ABC transporter substrate-binding protein [Anaerolineae bacterium]